MTLIRKMTNIYETFLNIIYVTFRDLLTVKCLQKLLQLNRTREAHSTA